MPSRGLLVALAVALASVPASAQNVSRRGTTAAPFLTIGVGARGTALGGAFTATADDVTALYWNPAGLTQMRTAEAVTVHSDWFADVNHDFAGVALPLAGGVVGASVTLMGVPEMIVRTELNQQGTGQTFDASDLAVGLSYGRQITDRFALGGTVKYVQQRIWNSTASGVAVDLGTQFRTDFLGGLTIGAQLSNFGSDLQLDGRDLRTFVDPAPGQEGNNGRIPADFALDEWSIPLDFKLGVVTRPIDTRMNRLTVAVDALHPSSDYESLNVGVEYGFRERFYLRGRLPGGVLGRGRGRALAGRRVPPAAPLPRRHGEDRPRLPRRRPPRPRPDGRAEPIVLRAEGFRVRGSGFVASGVRALVWRQPRARLGGGGGREFRATPYGHTGGMPLPDAEHDAIPPANSNRQPSANCQHPNPEPRILNRSAP